MWLPALGLLLGILLGVLFAGAVPPAVAPYSALAVLVALDSVVGAARAEVEQRYTHRELLLGLVTSAGLAAGLTYLGDHLGIELHLAAVVALGLRTFHNAAHIRRLLFGAAPHDEGNLAGAEHRGV
jgi:small basic protein